MSGQWARPAYSYIIHWLPDGGAKASCGRVPSTRALGSGWYETSKPPGAKPRRCVKCVKIVGEKP